MTSDEFFENLIRMNDDGFKDLLQVKICVNIAYII